MVGLVDRGLAAAAILTYRAVKFFKIYHCDVGSDVHNVSVVLTIVLLQRARQPTTVEI